MKQVLFIILIITTGSLAAWGYPWDYGPFEESEKPKPYPMKECELLSSVADDNYTRIYEFSKDNNDPVVLTTSSTKKNNYGFTVGVKTKTGKELVGPTLINEHVLYPFVYCGYLNEDKRLDYVIVGFYMGCGLAAGNADVTFLLSNGESYRMETIFSMFPDVNDFVDLDKDGRPEFIKTNFVYGEEGKDGKVHNYWAYHLFKFKGDQIVLADNVSKKFPCLIWYTFKPNHKDTKQLTKEQKRRLLDEVKSKNYP